MGQGLGLGRPGQDEEVDARGSGGSQCAGGFEGRGAGGHDVVDEEDVCPARGRRGAEGAVDVPPALGGREGRLRRRFPDPRQERSEGPTELSCDLLRQEAPGVVAAFSIPSSRGGDRNDGAGTPVEAAGAGGRGHESASGRGEDVVPAELQGVDEPAGDARVPHDGGRTRYGRRAVATGAAERRRGRKGARLAGVVAVEERKRPPALTAEAASADAAPGGTAGGAARREQEVEENPPGEEGHGPEGARHGRNSRRDGTRLRMPDMHIDAPFSVPLSCRRMKAPRSPRLARAALLFLSAAASVFVGSAASAQTFAVGAGGGILNDTVSAANLDNFSTGAWYGFAEMTLDPGILMQARYTRMQLPPSAENGPEIDVDAATLSIAYLFKEDWWQAGFVMGGGGYFLHPKNPGPGQVVTDPDESVFGLNGGLLTVFTVNRKFNIRLEAVGHLLRDTNSRKPVIFSAALAWKF